MIYNFLLTDNLIKDKLQKLSIEVESRQSLLAFMISHDMMNNYNFSKYEDEYKEFYILYEQEKQNFQKIYIDPILIDKKADPTKSSWYLDFNTGEVTVTLYE